jgi:hypothetical protein
MMVYRYHPDCIVSVAWAVVFSAGFAYSILCIRVFQPISSYVEKAGASPAPPCGFRAISNTQVLIVRIKCNSEEKAEKGKDISSKDTEKI